MGWEYDDTYQDMGKPREGFDKAGYPNGGDMRHIPEMEKGLTIVPMPETGRTPLPPSIILPLDWTNRDYIPSRKSN